MFNAGDYQTINLDDWMATNPAYVLQNNLQIPAEVVNRLPASNQDFSAPKR